MEVVQEWRGAVDTVGKTASWGADAQKLMHVMMGQFGAPDQQQASEVTLDLLGKTGHVDEFLEVDTDREPMPSGWEKCLDLKTGELYFVSKSMGMRTSEDPRKQQQQPQSQQQQQQQGVIAPRTPARPAHEFLASKKVETLRASTSGSSGSGEQDQPAAAPPGRRLWNDHTVVRSPESNLELNLNLSPSPPPVPAAAHTTTSQAAVCTMEMVQQALKRTEKAMGKREAPSSSFSAGSLSWTSRSSPSTSSSSTSKSADAPAQQQPRMNYEAETSSGSGGAVELAMGKCARCSMMVMVQKKDPKCPSCASSEVSFVTFGAAAKRQRLDQTTA